MITNSEWLNILKGIRKMQKRESLFKYQSHLYNVQRNDDVKYRGMKLLWNNRLFPLLNIINGKISPYGSRGTKTRNLGAGVHGY